MEEYEIYTLAAGAVLTHWIMGYVWYKIGRWTERQQWHHLYTKITDQQIENGQLKAEIELADEKIKLLELANEQIYDEGKRDQIKETVKEMVSDHNQLSFEKIPKKNTLKEGGEEDANNITNRVDSSRSILLDDIHGS